jgi:4-amino-4-deoxy-L-arabinose transferase-like glycosyltransferase
MNRSLSSLDDAVSGLTLTRPTWWALVALLCAACVATGLIGIGSVPLDSHEIFVAQTAHEMAERDDWVVPYFNGEPRLNKPPVSYWAAGTIAWLAGDLPRVAEWHVRLVSVVAGIGLVLSTLWLGATLFERSTALVAGFMLVSSSGLFSFMHDARPDLLYAMWTALMLACAAHAAYRAPARRAPLFGAAGGLWVAFALATLTKGPHVPALALAGLALHLRFERGTWKAVNAVLRPLPGLMLALALCAPWWWWMTTRLSASRLETSQLGGTLLLPGLKQFGDPYYLYRPLELLLPWLPLIVVAVFLLASHSNRARLGFLLWPLALATLGLSFGRQYRFFYLLPLISLLVLVVARPLALYAQAPATRPRRWALGTGIAVQGAVIAVGAGWVFKHAAETDRLSAVSIAMAAGFIVGVLVATSLRTFTRSVRVFVALALTMTALWGAAAMTRALWAEERFDAQRLAMKAATELAEDTPLATFDVSPTIYVYYAARTVREAHSPDELANWLQASRTGRLGLIVRASESPEICARFACREIDRYRRGDLDDVLFVLEPRADAP